MQGPKWHDDADSAELHANLASLYDDVLTHALGGDPPSIDLVQSWHERMHQGLPVPEPSYVGRFRGDPHPYLLECEVHVKGVPGVRSYLVWGEVDALIRWLADEVEQLKESDSSVEERDEQVLQVAARMHGEWVRIHPFVNGNGRTARLWVLWVCARFGIPALLKVRPRPGQPYGTASLASMSSGDHTAMLLLLKQKYAELPADDDDGS